MQSEHSTENLYSNYLARTPHPIGERMVRGWHRRMFSRVTAIAGSPLRILEVGPGHGYFADECRSQNVEYVFCDNSGAVHREMTVKGFSGYVSLIHGLDESVGTFDMVWMSHVLEHSPTWLEARRMVEAARSLLRTGGSVVVISPDLSSWRYQFWNGDATHGYPTTVRNVVQLLTDVGLDVVVARHHRNASFSLLMRALMRTLCLLPHQVVDAIVDRRRFQVGEGYLYSWKTVFGWRQVLVIGTTRPSEREEAFSA